MTSSNQIKVQQAFYGEVNNGHGCLFSTIEDSSLNAFLIAFTDRPGAFPAGLEMMPYYSGMKYNGFYIFTLTFPDENARRGGIVFTHALILEVGDLEHINNLENLFRLFCNEIPAERHSLTVLSFEQSKLNTSEFSETVPSYIIKSVQMLAGGKTPIVFCGDSEEFIKMMSAVWKGLPISFRSKISFTSGFVASNIDKTKTFIHFQGDLIDALHNIEHISGIDSAPETIEGVVEKFILKPQTDSNFEAFLSELNVDLTDWNILKFSAKAYEAYSEFLQLDNDALKQLIRFVAKISPNRINGKDIKDKQITALSDRVLTGQEYNVKSLRNLPLESFDSGELKIGTAVKSFVDHQFGIKTFNNNLIAEVLTIANGENPKIWWHTAVLAGLHAAIASKKASCFQNIWSLLAGTDEVYSIILDSLPYTSEYEDLLVKNMPKDISAHVAEKLIVIANTRRWQILHANLLLAYLPAEDALLKQFAFEKEIARETFEGTDMILLKVTDNDLLEIALQTRDDYFINEFVKRILLNAVLLNDLDIRNQLWVHIWSLSLEQTNDLDYGIVDLPEKIEILINEISEGKAVPELIIKKIAESPFADLTRIKNRANVWKYLKSDPLSLFLDATANSLLKDIASIGFSGVQLEVELNSFIASDQFMTGFLRKHKDDLDTVLALYEQIPNLKDRFLSDYIRYFSGSIKDLQSERLGNLVRIKGYSDTAYALFQKAKSSNSYRIALNKCRGLLNLSFLDRLMYGHLFGQSLSREEIYSAFAEICIELYPKGPEDSDIWNRAGGDISKLFDSRSREQNWKAAINLLKNGGGGIKISVQALIKTMMEDFPNNPQLKHIINTFK